MRKWIIFSITCLFRYNLASFVFYATSFNIIYTPFLLGLRSRHLSCLKTCYTKTSLSMHNPYSTPILLLWRASLILPTPLHYSPAVSTLFCHYSQPIHNITRYIIFIHICILIHIHITYTYYMYIYISNTL